MASGGWLRSRSQRIAQPIQERLRAPVLRSLDVTAAWEVASFDGEIIHLALQSPLNKCATKFRNVMLMIQRCGDEPSAAPVCGLIPPVGHLEKAA